MWTYTTCKCLRIQYTYIPPYQKYIHPGETKTFKPCRSPGVGWSLGTKSLWTSGVNNPLHNGWDRYSSWWFQQIWKMWSSIWLISPSRGETCKIACVIHIHRCNFYRVLTHLINIKNKGQTGSSLSLSLSSASWWTEKHIMIICVYTNDYLYMVLSYEMHDALQLSQPSPFCCSSKLDVTWINTNPVWFPAVSPWTSMFNVFAWFPVADLQKKRQINPGPSK